MPTTSPIASWAFSGAPRRSISFEQIGNRRDNPFATSREHAYNVNQPATAFLPQYDEYIAEAIYSFDSFDIKYTGGYTFYDYRLRTDADGTSVQVDAVSRRRQRPTERNRHGADDRHRPA